MQIDFTLRCSTLSGMKQSIIMNSECDSIQSQQNHLSNHNHQKNGPTNQEQPPGSAIPMPVSDLQIKYTKVSGKIYCFICCVLYSTVDR